MSTPRLPPWYRHAWWLPGMGTAFAVALVLAAFEPAEHSLLLSIAILCALPWSLALLLVEVGHGFADRAAVIVALGVCANAALLWWLTAVIRLRWAKGQSRSLRSS